MEAFQFKHSLHKRLVVMTRTPELAAILLLSLALLLHNVTSFPFKFGIHHDLRDRRLADSPLDAGVDGGKGSLHTFRETAVGLSSHPDFLKGNRVHSTEFHDVVFVIKEKNIDELTRILYDISNPASVNYGNHMTYQQIDDLVSNPVAHEEVVAYLVASGATVMHEQSQGECITARAEIGLWERMLNTEFHSYSKVTPESASQSTSFPTEFIRSEKYSVPAGLDDHVAYIFNTVQVPVTKYQRDFLDNHHPIKPATKSGFSESSNTFGGFTSPAQILKAYNIDDNSGHPRATQAALEAFNQKFSPEDLLSFQDLYDLPRTAANKTYLPMTYTAAQCAAANYDVCIESNIDMMYLLAVADTPTIHYYTTLSTFAQWAQFVANSGVQPPLIISISYGDDERIVTFSEYNMFEVSTLKIGVMGSTILISAGDDGVHTGKTRSNAALCGYRPQYPTSCPYVISVGATNVRNFFNFSSSVKSRLTNN